MKELYFAPYTIDTIALEMRQAAGGVAHRDRFTFKPERSALLVLDMQTHFLDASSHA